MFKTILMRLAYIFIYFYSLSALSWQDDAELFMRDPLELFTAKQGLSVLSAARSEIRVGRYIERDKLHAWRGGLSGDIVFLSMSPDLLWRWGLNMETLVDDNNDISFRLVQVYYQSLTGLFWHTGPGVASLSFSHRCSHGTDNAEQNRILIRSGPQLAYEFPLFYKKLKFLVMASLNAYLWGQNSDFSNQSRGQGLLAVQMSWPLYRAWSLALGSSFGEELIAEGKTDFFVGIAPAPNKRLRPFGGAKLGLSIEGERVKNEYSLSFSHIPDTGFTKTAHAHSGLSLDISFYW